MLRFFGAASLIMFATTHILAQQSDAARVAVIRFEDKTGTKNFGYMPESLQDAITKSMHRRFEFIEVDPKAVEPVVAQVRKKNKGVITPKEAAEICRLANIDILIYGNFTFEEAQNKIFINTEISLGSTDKFRKIDPTENRVDATIFRAADKVAGDIVLEITKVAQEQQKAKGEATAAEAKKGKTQLEKTEKTKTWADINWVFSGTLGIATRLASHPNTREDPISTINLDGLYRFKGPIHLGGFVTLQHLESHANNTPYRAFLDYGALGAYGGYYFDLSSHWRWTTNLGMGYYVGSLNLDMSGCANPGGCMPNPDVKTGKSTVYNPFFLIRTGIHFMVFSFLAVGLEADYRMLYDSKPVHIGGGMLSISYVF